MTETSTVDLSALRTPFPPEFVGKLPRVICPKCSQRGTDCDEHRKAKCEECGNYLGRHIHLDYVGHADVTIRLLEVDPEWSWKPQATDPDPDLLKAAIASGDPEIVRQVIENAPPKFETDRNGSPVGLWIRLTVGGVTRPGVGSCPSGQNDAEKVLIGDALRNAAMRFGVAVDLWAKGDRADPTAENATASAGQARRGSARQSASDAFENAAPAPPRQNGSNGAQRDRAPRPAQPRPNTQDQGNAPATSWPDKATARAASLKTEAEGTELWQETVEKAHNGEITGEDKKRIGELIGGQVEYLRTEAMEQALRFLSEADEWRLKVQEIDGTDAAREAIAEVTREVSSKVRAGRIIAAITARWPKAAEQEVRAA